MQIDSFLIFGVLKRSTKVYFLSLHSVSAYSNKVCEESKSPARHFSAVSNCCVLQTTTEIYVWRDVLQALGSAVDLRTFHDVTVGSGGLPISQEPPCRFWKPPAEAVSSL